MIFAQEVLVTCKRRKGKTRSGIRESYKVPVRIRGLGITSLMFGFLGDSPRIGQPFNWRGQE
jgi:hypothetical protein